MALTNQRDVDAMVQTTVLLNNPSHAKSQERTLTPEHVAELAASGIDAESALAAGVYCETDPKENGLDLNWKTAAKKIGSCLTFMYLGLVGKPMTYTDSKGVERPYTRKKPSCPRMSKPKIDSPDGKIVKYESPPSASPRRYIPNRFNNLA